MRYFSALSKNTFIFVFFVILLCVTSAVSFQFSFISTPLEVQASLVSLKSKGIRRMQLKSCALKSKASEVSEEDPSILKKADCDIGIAPDEGMKVKQATGDTSLTNQGATGVMNLPLALFGVVGKSTRWTVALSVAAGLVILRDPFTLAMVVGAVINAFLSKLLKKIINQNRPEEGKSVKESSGMPSSHAMSLFFFASFLSIASQNTASWCPFSSIAVSTFLFSYAIIASSWRVYSGLHTLPQIIVGSIAGSCTGTSWIFFCQSEVSLVFQKIFGPTIPNEVLALVLALAAFSIGFFQNKTKSFVKSVKKFE
mmetsp:Transcript_41035/g.54034  ORF Transcript_41035/g.54034 Transcript_41035/m.54034 type:complete len:312 (+) Transcript_41035:1-936(+)